MPTCELDNVSPFERITVTRLRNAEGEFTNMCEVEGFRQGWSRHVPVPYLHLFDQAHAHLERWHGKGENDPISGAEFEHGWYRAAIAFLID